RRTAASMCRPPTWASTTSPDPGLDGTIIGEWGREGEAKVDVVLRARLPQMSVDEPDGQTRLIATALAAAPLTTPSGDVVPLGTLADIEERHGPAQIRRIERARSITLQVTPPDELALESAMELIRARVSEMQQSEVIPAGVDINLSGTAGKLEQSKGRFAEVLLLAVVISFLLLAALFEDFIAPIAVLVTVPLAGAGGSLGLLLVDRYLGDQPFDLITAMGFLILIAAAAVDRARGQAARAAAGRPDRQRSPPSRADQAHAHGPRRRRLRPQSRARRADARPPAAWRWHPGLKNAV